MVSFIDLILRHSQKFDGDVTNDYLIHAKRCLAKARTPFTFILSPLTYLSRYRIYNIILRNDLHIPFVIFNHYSDVIFIDHR